MIRNFKVLLSSAAFSTFVVAGGTVVAVLPASGYAQDRTPDEIIVSARRKDESLQEVPLAISVLDDETIKRFGVNDTKDITKYSASLQFDEGLGAQDRRIVIRGLAPTRGRSNVAILVDGVDYTGEAVSTAGGGVLLNQALLDVERVEVVKGPQSALYGRSAFGGAIQYISKKPSLDETEGSLDVEFGTSAANREGMRVSGAYGGPVTDDLALRVNGLVYDQEGYYNNRLTGQSVGGSDGFGLALSGLWNNGGALTVSGRIAGSRDEYEPQPQARVANNALVDINDSVAVVEGTPGPGQTNNLIGTSNLAVAVGDNRLYPNCQVTPGGVIGQGVGTDNDNTLTSCLATPKTLTVGRMPDADSLRILQSEDPRTGGNYPGTEVDLISSSLTINYDLDGGQFSSYTGFAALDSDQFFDGQNDPLPAGTYTNLFDQLTFPGGVPGPIPGNPDYQGYSFTLAPCGWEDCSPTRQEINFTNRTRLFSQEFRFASDLDGPLNYTLGALYWKENVRQLENGATISPSGAFFRAPADFFGLVRSTPLPAPPIESQAAANDLIADVFEPSQAVVRRNTESISFYGLLEWDIADTVKATFEGRWVTEELEVSGPVCDTTRTPLITGVGNQGADPLDPTQPCNLAFRGSSSVATASGTGALDAGTQTKAAFLASSARFDDDFFAPKATIEWLPTDTNTVYFSVAQGIKPGGISTITAGSFFNAKENTFDKEELLTFELGSKNSFLDGSLVLNGALFYQDYTDKQVGVTRFDTVIQADVGSIENAGEAEIWGLELDSVWQITDNLSLSGSYAYTNAEYTKFEIETGSANNVARNLAAGGDGCLEVIPSNNGADDDQREKCLVSLTGNKIEDVPEHSFVGNLRYVAQLADTDYEWFGEASVIYNDERFIDEWNTKELDSYWTADVRAGLISDEWEVVFFVDNAFDDDTVKSAVDFGSIVNSARQGFFPPSPTDGVVVTLPDPRVAGVRANFRF